MDSFKSGVPLSNEVPEASTSAKVAHGGEKLRSAVPRKTEVFCSTGMHATNEWSPVPSEGPREGGEILDYGGGRCPAVPNYVSNKTVPMMACLRLTP